METTSPLQDPLSQFDLVVVGGGVNGCGIARDAAGRGLRVLLAEKGDLGGATSSNSSKLIHGGLRYLEHYEFRLVRESLIERERLLRIAPHIIRPLRFVLPVHRELRPPWMLRTGLFMYDHLGGRKLLPATTTVKRGRGPALDPLKPQFKLGFEYSDCWVEDARLVVLNARDAADRGAEVLVRSMVTGARRVDGLWEVEIAAEDGGVRRVRTRGLVNAAGPWVGEVLQSARTDSANRTPKLVKGSHIVVPRLYDGSHAFTFQSGDGRVVFAIPYEGDFTLIGTTDIEFDEDATAAKASPEEIEYLCGVASEYFRTPVRREDVVWTYSGVRPLYDDGSVSASALTRDYAFDLDQPDGQAPLLSIYGGKLTTYRKLAEHALRDLRPVLQLDGRPWTADAALPGGEIEDADVEAFFEDRRRRYAFAPEVMVRRLGRAYGTCIDAIMGNARKLGDLGDDFGCHLHEAELQYLRDQEWARTAEDVLWRRSKLGLHLPPPAHDAVARWFGS